MLLRLLPLSITIAAFLLPAAPLAAQPDRLPIDPSPPILGHHEIPDDAYVPVPFAWRQTGPAGRCERDGYISVQVNTDRFGNDILLDAANEPTIAVDPNDPNRIVVGWRQFDTIASNFRQAGVAYSIDNGRTWTFPGSLQHGIFRSDPVLDVDADGVFYYNSLLVDQWGVMSCSIFKSYDGGRTWDNGIFAYGGDKQWMAIDRTGGMGHGNIYANWTRAWSVCFGQFTASFDYAESFIDCLDVPGQPYWGTVTVGPDGALYIAGDGFIVVKSSTMQNPLHPPAFDFAVAVDLGGDLLFSGGPNPGGLLGQAYIDTDHSGGPHHGNVYLLCSVDPPDADPMDVMFARSTDGGLTWSSPVRVNDVRSGYQWFGTMSVAPNGRIDAVWADTRDGPFVDSVLYYAFSEDAGETWSTSVPLSGAFDPNIGWPQQNKIGDYYDMVSDNVGAHLAYAATFNGGQDVYYLRIGDHDCNNNGIPDTQDIDTGASPDDNANGVPDECEHPPCWWDCADQPDGFVGHDDLAALLANWGHCSIPGLCPWDCEGFPDNFVDVDDLVALINHWGPCP